MAKDTMDFAQQNTERAMQAANWMHAIAEQNLNQTKGAFDSLLAVARKAVRDLDRQTAAKPLPLPVWDRQSGKLFSEWMDDHTPTYESEPRRSVTQWNQIAAPSYDRLYAAYQNTRLVRCRSLKQTSDAELKAHELCVARPTSS